jgi:hypothetical protein
MIDINKKYRTRDGREVRIYATDGGGPCPVHGAIKNDDVWQCTNWLSNGLNYGNSKQFADIIEVKPRIQRTMWVNVYPNPISTGAAHLSKKIADQNAMSDRLACVKVEIDCEEGEGL